MMIIVGIHVLIVMLPILIVNIASSNLLMILGINCSNHPQ
jgi:hypothetical protein